MGIYAGLKAAVETFSNSLLIELGVHDVKVGCIAPGSTQTGILLDLRCSIGISPDAPSADAEGVAAAVRFMLEQPDRIYSAGEGN
jgi:serine 3-dehydrogenase